MDLNVIRDVAHDLFNLVFALSAQPEEQQQSNSLASGIVAVLCSRPADERDSNRDAGCRLSYSLALSRAARNQRPLDGRAKTYSSVHTPLLRILAAQDADLEERELHISPGQLQDDDPDVAFAGLPIPETPDISFRIE